jgi:hypothetical protein
VNWISKLWRLSSGVDSKAAARQEKSEWTRKTVRSVEITVETEEIAWSRSRSQPYEPLPNHFELKPGEQPDEKP